MQLLIAVFIWKPAVNADSHGPKIIGNTYRTGTHQDSPGLVDYILVLVCLLALLHWHHGTVFKVLERWNDLSQ